MIHTVAWNHSPPVEARGGAVAIGNFDGVHRGHAALVAELRRKAETLGGPAVVVTFDPHPLKLLRPDLFQPVLTTAAHRAELLLACGADHVLLLQTNSDLLNLTAEEFYRQVIRERLAARCLVEGMNFGFGRGREGNVETLRRLGKEAGIDLIVVPPVKWEDKPVSSSRVREALLRGDVQEAARLLNRFYRLRGVVVTGRRRGHTLGFPTANLEQIETLLPGDGVYAVRATLPSPGGDKAGSLSSRTGDTEGGWPGAANIGPNPTFGEQAQKVEVHLIGFQGDLVGHALAVDFIARLRDTRTFRTVDELVEQLHLDISEAEKIARST
jgi:riboflavin kinase/FMN adenylyltransferase